MIKRESEFTLLLEGREYICRVKRAKRKSISLRVLRDGSISIGCPWLCSRAELEALLRQKAQRINEMRSAQEKLPSKLTEAELNELKKLAREDMTRRTEHYAKLLGLTYGRIAIRAQKSRWGSCSSKKNLNFNCLLELCPEEVLDYVAVHELCHLKEMNHSPRFWQLVEGVYPDYARCRDWLKKNGGEIMGRL